MKMGPATLLVLLLIILLFLLSSSIHTWYTFRIRRKISHILTGKTALVTRFQIDALVPQVITLVLYKDRVVDLKGELVLMTG